MELAHRKISRGWRIPGYACRAPHPKT